MSRARSIAASLAVLAAATAASAPAASDDGIVAPPNSEAIHISYNGSLAFFRVVKITVDAVINEEAFDAKAGFRTTGLAGLLKDSEIEATSNGWVVAGDLIPGDYEHRNKKSRKNRVIQVVYRGPTVTPNVVPDFGSHGDPPPTPEQLSTAYDPLTTFASLALDRSGAPCDRSIDVFDGKQLFNLRFEPVKAENMNTRGYEGPTLKCHAYYTPVAGFDEEDLAAPEVYERPIQLWFAEVRPGVNVPVLIKTTVSGIGVNVELRNVRYAAAANVQRAAAEDPGDEG